MAEKLADGFWPKQMFAKHMQMKRKRDIARGTSYNKWQEKNTAQDQQISI